MGGLRVLFLGHGDDGDGNPNDVDDGGGQCVVIEGVSGKADTARDVEEVVRQGVGRYSFGDIQGVRSYDKRRSEPSGNLQNHG